MIEKVYHLARTDEKTIEKVLLDENIHYLHMVLPQNEGLPVHETNAAVYMTVARGTLTIRLAENEANRYETGTLLKIPRGTLMDARNIDEDTLELIVVKAPAPAL